MVTGTGDEGKISKLPIYLQYFIIYCDGQRRNEVKLNGTGDKKFFGPSTLIILRYNYIIIYDRIIMCCPETDPYTTRTSTSGRPVSETPRFDGRRPPSTAAATVQYTRAHTPSVNVCCCCCWWRPTATETPLVVVVAVVCRRRSCIMQTHTRTHLLPRLWR